MKNCRSVLGLFFLALIMAISSCGVKTIQGSGEILSETRDVSGFDEIELEGLGRVILIQGEEESLTIETDDNLLQYITTNLRGRELQIKFKNKINLVPTEAIIFRIYLRDLKSITASGGVAIEGGRLSLGNLEVMLNGAAMVKVDWLTATELKIVGNGVGNIVFAGEVERQEVELNGLGNYTAPNLQSQITEIVIGGAGNAVVWAEDTLDVEINGTGDVSYFGSPTLIEDLGFGGDLNHLGDK
jgi:hypothetical protein